MTAKGQLTLLGAPSTGLSLRDKWQSGLSTDRRAFLVRSPQESGGRTSPGREVDTLWRSPDAAGNKQGKTVAKGLDVS